MSPSSLARLLIRRFSNPIVRRPAVHTMHEDECVNSFFHQPSRCFEHQIIPLTILQPLLRFQRCVVDADCHASVFIDYERRTLRRHPVLVSHDALETSIWDRALAGRRS